MDQKYRIYDTYCCCWSWSCWPDILPRNNFRMLSTKGFNKPMISICKNINAIEERKSWIHIVFLNALVLIARIWVFVPILQHSDRTWFTVDSTVNHRLIHSVCTHWVSFLVAGMCPAVAFVEDTFSSHVFHLYAVCCTVQRRQKQYY